MSISDVKLLFGRCGFGSLLSVSLLFMLSLWFQESLCRCSVADSLPSGLRSLWNRCISIQACKSPGRRATWGAGQILLCPEALHQPDYQTEVRRAPRGFWEFWRWNSCRRVCDACVFWCTGMEREIFQILCSRTCWWGRARRASPDQTSSGKSCFLCSTYVYINIVFFFLN